MMKQPQFAPLSVALMAVSLFLINEGCLDDVEVKAVVAFEAAFHAHLVQKQKALIESINKKPELTDALKTKLHGIVSDFKKILTCELSSFMNRKKLCLVTFVSEKTLLRQFCVPK